MQELEELQRNAFFRERYGYCIPQPSAALISVQDLHKIRPVNTVAEREEVITLRGCNAVNGS